MTIQGLDVNAAATYVYCKIPEVEKQGLHYNYMLLGQTKYLLNKKLYMCVPTSEIQTQGLQGKGEHWTIFAIKDIYFLYNKYPHPKHN